MNGQPIVQWLAKAPRWGLACGLTGLFWLQNHADAQDASAANQSLVAQSTQTLPAPTSLSESIPPVPPLPAGAVNMGSAIAGGAFPAPGAARPSMLQVLSSAQRGFCARVRTSPIGQLASGMRKPLSVLSGGLVAEEKAPHPDEQAQPGPEGTAAQIKAVELQAPKRRSALQALKGTDVRYHPEAEGILMAALRSDPSECVRYEAALTIATLPVCTEPISKALRVCIQSATTDGNPAELSERVRTQAAFALSRCQNCMPNVGATDIERPEYPVGDKSPSLPQSTPVASNNMTLNSTTQVASWNRAPAKALVPGATMPAVTTAAQSMHDGSIASPTGTQQPTNARLAPTNLLDVWRAARDETAAKP